MDYEPLQFVLITTFIMSIVFYYLGAGKYSLIQLCLGGSYGVLWVVFAILVKFFA
ncbi:MAG: hypothetical protein UIC65_02725 [Alphaproteobacteria bacterium]|nr:hypothetical protein [Alphaproteobacteria bacterium]